MAAAALVSHMEMSFDDVDDVRMAAEEAFVYASETYADEGEIRFEFLVGDDSIEIDVGLGDEAPTSDEDTERAAVYATFILESVCDRCEFVSNETGAHLRLLKRVGGIDADQA